MRRTTGQLLCLHALTMFCAKGADAAAAAHFASTGAPPGFDELARTREVLVDIYFGDRKVGEALALTRPGWLKFKSPAEVLPKLPQVIVSPQLAAALGGELPTNSSLVCSPSNAGQCGILRPQTIGIIYDDDRFRVDIFVSPRLLRPSLVG